MKKVVTIIIILIIAGSLFYFAKPENRESAKLKFREVFWGSENPDSDKSTIKIQVLCADEAEGKKVGGLIKVESPPSAGFSDKNFEIVIPGSKEIKAGPSAYEVIMFDLQVTRMTMKVYVDGKLLTPADEYSSILTDDHAMFRIKENGN